ncbi:MAG: nucleotidyltransferase family protein [Thermoanaerobaculia bacterium]
MSEAGAARSGVSGVLLAAGASSRFAGRRPKQLAPFAGEPLVRRAARTALASRLRELIAVVGFAPAMVREALAGLVLRVVENPDFRDGQASSLRTGLAAIDPAARAVLILPCDQPLLTAADLDRLITAHESAHAWIVLPRASRRRGAPTLFDRSLFGDLARLEGDAGGRQLFERLADRILEVELPDPRSLEDVDTAEDLIRLEAVTRARLPQT